MHFPIQLHHEPQSSQVKVGNGKYFVKYNGLFGEKTHKTLWNLSRISYLSCREGALDNFTNLMRYWRPSSQASVLWLGSIHHGVKCSQGKVSFTFPTQHCRKHKQHPIYLRAVQRSSLVYRYWYPVPGSWNITIKHGYIGFPGFQIRENQCK